MEDILLYNKEPHIESVVAWIDENWEQASFLDCTHFEFDTSSRFFIVSLWMQGMNSPQDYSEHLTKDSFEKVGNGWIRRAQDESRWHWLYYKKGKLFLITIR